VFEFQLNYRKLVLSKMKYLIVIAGLLSVSLMACENEMERRQVIEYAKTEALRLQETAKLPCRDEVVLVATTAGSPNSHTCSHPQQKARVEVTTKAGEEIGVTVFCECHRETNAEVKPCN
jgi:hypothetical protein